MTGSGLALGINVSHDRSAVLVEDGRVLCGIAEERLDRNKHSVVVNPEGAYLCTLPQRAIDYVLQAAGASIFDCQAIVAVGSVVYHPERPLRNLTVDDVQAQLPAGIERERISVLNHHLAHAVGAFCASPFSEAAVLVADGAGNVLEIRPGKRKIPEVEHTTFYHFQQNSFRELKKICSKPRAMNSLGAMYQLVTMFAGFGHFQEGKTMGLAPYGSPDLVEAWRAAVIRDDVLSYRIEPAFQTFDLRGRMIPADFVGQFGEPRHYSEPLRQVDKDLAYAVQHALESILVEMARDLRLTSQSKHLVLAGGVALNSVANQKVAVEAGFDSIFIVPCAADDGTALGAALWPWWQSGREKSWVMENAFLGRKYERAEHQAALDEHANELSWEKPNDLTKTVADRLAQGDVVGWFQGRSEIGPRALGNRSILCDPRRAENKDRLNEKVKYRESFRPFAPAVLAEHAEEFFRISQPSPFMLLVAEAKKPEKIPAAIHVDGTGRLQTVTAKQNARFYALIEAFYKKTEVPVLLNTSFNLAGEPIVETPTDAIDCFLKSNIDLLVLDDLLVEKKNPELCRQLAAKHRELVEAKRKIARQEAELEAIRRSRGWRMLNWLNQFRR